MEIFYCIGLVIAFFLCVKDHIGWDSIIKKCDDEAMLIALVLSFGSWVTVVACAYDIYKKKKKK